MCMYAFDTTVHVYDLNFSSQNWLTELMSLRTFIFSPNFLRLSSFVLTHGLHSSSFCLLSPAACFSDCLLLVPTLPSSYPSAYRSMLAYLRFLLLLLFFLLLHLLLFLIRLAMFFLMFPYIIVYFLPLCTFIHLRNSGSLLSSLSCSRHLPYASRFFPATSLLCCSSSAHPLSTFIFSTHQTYYSSFLFLSFLLPISPPLS